MTLAVNLIDEPLLEFGSCFLHADKKTGLSEFGPYGLTDSALHRPEIRVGIVGTRATVELAQQWLERCSDYIETDRTKKRPAGRELEPEDVELEASEVLVKGLSPDFVGLNATSPFKSRFVSSPRWESYFTDRDVKRIVEGRDPVARLESAADMLLEHVEHVATNAPHPDVILLALPLVLAKKAGRAPLVDRVNLDLRRAIKARAMRWGVPVQILLEDSLNEKRIGLQDRATRAWNFCVAMYYKAGGVPWRAHGLETGSCYVGITFYQTDNERGRPVLRSGVAQAFDYLGQGVVLRGQPFEWDPREEGRQPHLPTEEAQSLITRTLEAYQRFSGLPPRRVVVHKSSRYWGPEHGAHDERGGLEAGILSVNPRAQIDLLCLQHSRLRLARVGQYPPLRGTYATLGDRTIVYTHGFTPYFDTYPGVHVPEPWAIVEHHGDSGPRLLAAELLALSKMNVNNAAFADATPITLAFARKVSDVLRDVAHDMPVRSEYAYYI